MNGREDERERDEGQSVPRHRIDDRLRTEPSRESLCSEPVRRRDHAVGRREQTRPPEAEVRPHRDLPGKPVVDSRLRHDDEERVGERLARDHRRDGPPEREPAVHDRERSEHVHHRVQEEREVDREEIAPAGGAELRGDRLDAELLDGRHES